MIVFLGLFNVITIILTNYRSSTYNQEGVKMKRMSQSGNATRRISIPEKTKSFVIYASFCADKREPLPLTVHPAPTVVTPTPCRMAESPADGP
jgi:hypothetical protein